MSNQHRANPELWAAAEKFSQNSMDMLNCVLELRARIEVLEAAQLDQAESHRFCTDAIVRRVEALEAPMTEPRAASADLNSSAGLTSSPGGLVERVEEAIMNEDWLNNGLDESVCSDDDPNYRYTSTACNSGQSFHTLQARAAIREVIAAAKEADITHADTLVHWLEQEVDRG
jgi:hypothetical protein